MDSCSPATQEAFLLQAAPWQHKADTLPGWSSHQSPLARRQGLGPKVSDRREAAMAPDVSAEQ